LDDALLILGVAITAAVNSLIVIAILVKMRADHIQQRKNENGTHRPTIPPTQFKTKSEILSWRNKIISELEQERGTKVITMIHKKELWSGLDGRSEIGMEDAETVLQQIRHTPSNKPIDLILHTPGGHAVAAQMMAMAIKSHPERVTVMIPYFSMSGGSLMAVASDEIRMEKYSVLGPVDPQILVPDGNQWPAASLAGLPEKKPATHVSDTMLVMSDVAKLETENAIAFVKWLLADRMGDEKATEAAEFLARGYLAHFTPITLDVVKRLGLNVVEGIPEKVYDLFKTFALTNT